jgi:hypothetical protein
VSAKRETSNATAELSLSGDAEQEPPTDSPLAEEDSFNFAERDAEEPTAQFVTLSARRSVAVQPKRRECCATREDATAELVPSEGAELEERPS